MNPFVVVILGAVLGTSLLVVQKPAGDFRLAGAPYRRQQAR